jgi:hypothetical protein
MIDSGDSTSSETLKSCSFEMTLFRLSVEALVRHPERLTLEDMHMLPDYITVQLFEGFLAAGKLNPRLLVLFERIGCLEIEERIELLGISSWIPPLVEGHHSCTMRRRYM